MSRLFVADPVCAMEYGHSLNALKYFSDMAAPYFSETHMIASYHLPGETADDGIDRFFDFYYDFTLRIKRRALPLPLVPATSQHAGNRSASVVDFLRLLQKYDMNSADTVMFPSIDYYSALGVFGALRARPPAQRPKLLIRFIGVMENAAPEIPGPDALDAVLRQVEFYHAEGGVMTVCAETPKYAARLQKMLKIPVLTVPYFSPVIEAIGMPVDQPVTFLAGGSARADKGFFRLRSIIEQVNATIDPAQVRFIIQSSPDHMYNQHAGYLRSLQALPNVKMLPGQITYDEIRQSFANSHISLMPYDPEIYEWRGSAMLMESMLFQRLVICQNNTGFSDQAQRYQAGRICSSDAEFANAICIYAQMPSEQLTEYAGLARKYYIQDVDQACRHWITGEAS